MSTDTTFRAFWHVDGIPKGQPRPKAFKRGDHAGVYDPGTASEWKARICEAGREHRPAVPIECAVCVTMRFKMPRPKRLKPGRYEPCITRPDVDNLVKAVLDALTEDGWWRDDAQVVRIYVSKDYHIAATRSGMSIQIYTTAMTNDDDL